MNKKIIALRIVMTVLCVLMIGFIFSQSLQTGEESSATSSAVTDRVQKVAQQVAPESFAATATGEDYDFLHGVIRSIAHYTEFSILGILLCFCYFTYTNKRLGVLIPMGILVLVPMIDEWLQTAIAERAAEWIDVLYDFCGGVTGFGIGLLILTVTSCLYRI